MGTLDQGLPKTADTRIFTISSQANCHSAIMKHIADSSGALYTNLIRTSPQDAGRIISKAQKPISIAKASGCDDLHLTSSSGRFSLLGKLSASKGKITLSGPGAPAEDIVIDRKKAGFNRIVARAWAGMEAQKIALQDSAQTKEQLLALGRKYGLVTPGTSLLVLESLDQYLEYDIEPPATLPDMRKAFHKQKAALKKETDKQHKKKLKTVLSWWRARIEWWEREFTVDPHMISGPKKAPMAAEAMFDEMASEAPAPMAAAMEVGAGLEDLSMELSEEKEEDDGGPPSARASISIKPWSPDTPYLKAIKGAAQDQTYTVYLEQRREYAASPAFFLDCGDHFLSNRQKELGLRILSNLVEMGLDDAALMRMYAWRLQQAGEFDLAISLLERVRSERNDEPQSHRDLALALGERWQKMHHVDDAIRAMELFYDVILGEWANFPEIEIIALMELNRLIHFATNQNIAVPARIDTRLIKLLDLDVRISMSWDTDLTDVDLHVFEPTGEHAYYGHNLTRMGGLVSRDFTQGYGPEEYVLKKALPGKYIVKAHYYGSSQQTVSGACTVIVTVFTNYGREDENKQVLTLRLEQPSDNVVVGEVTIEGGDKVQDARPSDDAPDWKDKFKQLKSNMTIDEITAIVGQPAEIQGQEEMILIYRPEPGVVIHIKMAPRLVSVQQIMDGAVLDLI
jgi:hypothetical protein